METNSFGNQNITNLLSSSKRVLSRRHRVRLTLAGDESTRLFNGQELPQSVTKQTNHIVAGGDSYSSKMPVYQKASKSVSLANGIQKHVYFKHFEEKLKLKEQSIGDQGN